MEIIIELITCILLLGLCFGVEVILEILKESGKWGLYIIVAIAIIVIGYALTSKKS